MISKSFLDWCREKGADELLRCYQAGGNSVEASQLGFSSTAVANFRCTVCGYEWQRSLNKTTRKGALLDCPSCHGRVLWGVNHWTEKFPELLRQWDFDQNDRAPEDCPITHEQVHWRCKKCRNGWTASISDRVRSAERMRRSGGELCPYCGRRKISPLYNLAACYPEVARQWDYTKNGGLRPELCFPAGNQKVWWRCDFDPSHSWQDRIANRTILRRGCPLCSRQFKMTYTSRVLFYYLRQVFPDCACEYPEGRYHLDICLPSHRIAIEHQGYTHQRDTSQRRDERRRAELLKKGYRHVLWLVESESPLTEYVREGDVLTYYDPSPYTNMNQLVCYVFTWLEALIGEVIHWSPPDFIRDHTKIEQTYYHERKKRSLAVLFPDFTEEWSEKNESSPDTVLPGSSLKAIWNCAKCHREYRATVANRTKQHSGCPYCAGKLPTEENNAAVLYPHLLAEWDSEKNDKSLYELLPNTKYLASWICRNCGYRWETMLYNRASSKGSRCPVCARTIPTEETSLAAKNPALAALWHPEKNGDTTPDKVMAQSNKQWWWRCEKGHEWQGSPNSMTKTDPSRLCPYCNNRKVCPENCLETVNPSLAAQWHPEKNGSLTPQDVTFSSPKGVWWRCSRGHTFRASVYSRNIQHTGCPYCINLKVSADNCLEAVFPILAAQWHPSKNGTLTPRDVTAQSSKNVWWRCERGHEWKTQVNKRSVRGQNCPYCSGRRVSPEHCLASVCPDLVQQWHPEKNAPLTPWEVSPSSGQKVWWRCEKGHEWQASISNRKKGRGCPQCAVRARKGITLEAASPSLAAQWHPTRNSLPPSAYLAYSNKKVWWRCEKGHEWQASPDTRMNGSGCPYCVGRLPSGENCLAAIHPSLAAEWDYEGNQPLTPEQVLPRSMQKVSWVCRTCGHRWTAPIAYRADGSGCPVCRQKQKQRKADV